MNAATADGFAIGLDVPFLYLDQAGHLVRREQAHVFESKKIAEIAADLHTARTEVCCFVVPVLKGHIVPVVNVS